MEKKNCWNERLVRVISVLSWAHNVSKISAQILTYSEWSKLSHCLDLIIRNALMFLKMGQPRPLFCLFLFFSITILQKNCRPQRDSNSDRRSRRRARWPLDHHHGPWNALMLALHNLVLIFYSWGWAQTENNAHSLSKGKNHCTADIQLDWFGLISFLTLYLTTDLLVWLTPNQCNRTSGLLWYFHNEVSEYSLAQKD